MVSQQGHGHSADPQGCPRPAPRSCRPSAQGRSAKEGSGAKAQRGQLKLGKGMATWINTELVTAQEPGVRNTHGNDRRKLLVKSKTHKHATGKKSFAI